MSSASNDSPDEAIVAAGHNTPDTTGDEGNGIPQSQRQLSIAASSTSSNDLPGNRLASGDRGLSIKNAKLNESKTRDVIGEGVEAPSHSSPVPEREVKAPSSSEIPGKPRSAVAGDITDTQEVTTSTKAALQHPSTKTQQSILAKSNTRPNTKGKEENEEWNEKQEYDDSQAEVTSPIPGGEFDEKARVGENVEAKPEIENIMQQFGKDQGTEASSILSPSVSELPVFQYPPRSSSLHGGDAPAELTTSITRVKSLSIVTNSSGDSDSKSVPYTPSITSAPPPPEPDPEPDLPFDFHRFLEQLRHRTADPVAKFLRSFLVEFGKKQWQVHEQVKIITDFLTFISGKMAQCEVWRTVSEAEFDNAREGMEKLVMNRLYNQTFSPEIPPAEAVSNKGRRKGSSPALAPGRRGQHEEDVERDEVLAQKVRIYGWIREEHLDIRPFGEKGKKFLNLAQQELTRIKSYRAPRDKVICVLNCCKVIFGYLRNAHTDQSADAFIPLLIYTVLKANPDHLVSNVQYILRFRNQEKLSGEAGYYMSSLMGAVQFIENLDRTNLTISDADFEANVEAAVSSIAEPHRQRQSINEEKRTPQLSAHPTFNEKSAPSRPEVTPRHSLDAERSSRIRAPSRNREPNSTNDPEENAAVAGLLRTIQKPLSTIGRLLSDESSAPQTSNRPSSNPPVSQQQSQSPRPPRSSSMQPSEQTPLRQLESSNLPPDAVANSIKPRISADEAAIRQASVESEQARSVTRTEHNTVVETLAGMFPDLDKEVISDVVRMKEGRVGLAVDACLALSR